MILNSYNLIILSYSSIFVLNSFIVFSTDIEYDVFDVFLSILLPIIIYNLSISIYTLDGFIIGRVLTYSSYLIFFPDYYPICIMGCLP